MNPSRFMASMTKTGLVADSTGVSFVDGKSCNRLLMLLRIAAI